MEPQIHLEPDLHVAGYLLARGFALLGLQKVGKRFAFTFQPEAQKAVRDYQKGGVIGAQDYAQALARLKDQLFAAKFKDENGNGAHGNYHRS